jgi:hypothetical protein
MTRRALVLLTNEPCVETTADDLRTACGLGGPNARWAVLEAFADQAASVASVESADWFNPSIAHQCLCSS